MPFANSLRLIQSYDLAFPPPPPSLIFWEQNSALCDLKCISLSVSSGPAHSLKTRCNCYKRSHRERASETLERRNSSKREKDKLWMDFSLCLLCYFRQFYFELSSFVRPGVIYFLKIGATFHCFFRFVFKNWK